jgi:hypothetical protein
MHRSDAAQPQEATMIEQWAIRDERTKFCVHAMRACGGTWMERPVGWLFREEADHANALVELYGSTRATHDQHETLLRMIADGTAILAWEIDLDALDPWWIEELDCDEARRLIGLGAQARRVLGRHPLEDLPEEVGDDRFDTSVFEREAEARRARVRSAA